MMRVVQYPSAKNPRAEITQGTISTHFRADRRREFEQLTAVRAHRVQVPRHPSMRIECTKFNAAQCITFSRLDRLRTVLSLRVIDIGITKTSDLSPLAALTKLQKLTLGADSVSEVTPLGALTNLQRLYLKGSAVSDVGPLAALRNLRVLGHGGD